MNLFAPEKFFSLEDFPFDDFWIPDAFVWEPLSHLEKIIQRLPNRGQKHLLKDVIAIRPETIFVHEEAIILPGTILEGPCWIGKGCRVGPHAYIRGPVILCDHSVVGHCCEVKNALFFPEAKAPHFNYVGDSILGRNANLGAGVKCANFRLDGQNISIQYQGIKQTTGLRKFGAIIGDLCKIGCNSVTNPGTLIPKGRLIHPCEVIHGYQDA